MNLSCFEIGQTLDNSALSAQECRGVSNLDKQPLKINVFPFLFVITVFMLCLIKIIMSVLEVGKLEQLTNILLFSQIKKYFMILDAM